MNKRDTDGRKLKHETLEELRIRSVKEVEAGESPEVVIQALGFHRSSIYNWLAAYRMISAVSAKGLLRFMTFTGKMNADNFIEFLQRLIYEAKRPIFPILDGHPVHKSRKVKAFVATTDGKLRLFILPPYSPHLHPDERVWNWLKKHNLGKTQIAGPDQFKAAVNPFMRRLQKLPKIVKGFFCDPNLAYINI